MQLPNIMLPDFDGCPFEEDAVWNIEWPNTPRNMFSTQNCPGELDVVTGKSCIVIIRSILVLTYTSRQCNKVL